VSDVYGLVVATLGGLAIGVERQWSGHASGPDARFAGVRTFTMLGGMAGLAGALWARESPVLAAVLLASAGALVVAAYVAASRRDVDGTTEVAALVVLAAGAAAGLGHTRLASGVIAVTVLLLVEKSRLHALVSRLDDAGMRAAVRFGVMAVVVLPLLPAGPFGPLGGVRPRELWMLVLFFSGLSFAAYLAQRAVGPERGYPVAGLLGGLISSTSVTLGFSRTSRADGGLAWALTAGVVAACTVLLLRILVATTVLNPPLTLTLVPYFVLPFLVGLASVGLSLGRAQGVRAEMPLSANPLQVRQSLEMAVLFQIVLVLVYLARDSFGALGVLVSGAVLGLTDMDALTLSMSRSEGLTREIAARAITIGVLSNTLLKGTVAAVVGKGTFRPATTGLLGLMAASLVVSLLLLG
jgi:uncharacterized membrane protein (DUF4010 family)